MCTGGSPGPQEGPSLCRYRMHFFAAIKGCWHSRDALEPLEKRWMLGRPGRAGCAEAISWVRKSRRGCKNILGNAMSRGLGVQSRCCSLSSLLLSWELLFPSGRQSGECGIPKGKMLCLETGWGCKTPWVVLKISSFYHVCPEIPWKLWAKGKRIHFVSKFCIFIQSPLSIFLLKKLHLYFKNSLIILLVNLFWFSMKYKSNWGHNKLGGKNW